MRKQHRTSFNELNESLIECEDASELASWLEVEKTSGCFYRAMRVYGRLSAVRRESEVKEIKRACGGQKRRAA